MEFEDVTDAGILCSLRKAMFAFANSGAQEYSVAGRTYRRAEVESIQRLIVTYEARVAASTSQSIGGGGVLVRLNDRNGPEAGFGRF